MAVVVVVIDERVVVDEVATLVMAAVVVVVVVVALGQISCVNKKSANSTAAASETRPCCDTIGATFGITVFAVLCISLLR